MEWESTTVEIILYYLTHRKNCRKCISTTVEIILYYLTFTVSLSLMSGIYNSRNYSILLNTLINIVLCFKSTTVEIILYYLTLSP